MYLIFFKFFFQFFQIQCTLWGDWDDHYSGIYRFMDDHYSGVYRFIGILRWYTFEQQKTIFGPLEKKTCIAQTIYFQHKVQCRLSDGESLMNGRKRPGADTVPRRTPAVLINRVLWSDQCTGSQKGKLTWFLYTLAWRDKSSDFPIPRRGLNVHGWRRGFVGNYHRLFVRREAGIGRRRIAEKGSLERSNN